MKKRLSEILLERGLVSREQLDGVLQHQSLSGSHLGSALVEQGLISEATLVRELSHALQIPMVDLSRLVPDRDAVASVPVRVCEQHDVFPVAMTRQSTGRTLLLAMADPLDEAALEEVAFVAEAEVKPAVAQLSSIEAAILRHHREKPHSIPPLGGDAFQVPPPRPTRPQLDDPTVLELSDLASDRSQPVVVGVSLMEPGTPSANGLFARQPTGTFAVVRSGEGEPVLEPLLLERELRPVEVQAVDALERKFWILMRSLHRRGAITREDFLAELGGSDDPSDAG